MTEHEKLLAGQDYDYRDPELQRMIRNAKQLISKLNNETEKNKKQAIAKELFAHIGTNLTINGDIGAIYGKHIFLVMMISSMVIVTSKIPIK